MSTGVSPASALTLAYAGTTAGASSLLPAIRLLREAQPAARMSLLWPEDLPLLPPLALLVERPVLYPSSDADRRSLQRAIEALHNEHAEWAVIFNEPGWSADVPAYIAYLAGIRLRFGIGSEFSGGLLSHVTAEPPAGRERDRHLFLLRSHGLAARSRSLASEPAMAGGAR